MKHYGICLFAVIGIALLSGQAPLFGCAVCHSKNPKVVKMHAEPRNKACFRCHGSGRIKNQEELSKQMTGDPLCTGCHKEERNGNAGRERP
ncbi:MAG: cytochrome c3 family protein [bacterium]